MCVNDHVVDDGVTVKFIAESVVANCSPNATINYGKENRGWVGDVPKFNYSIEKLLNLGWKPKLSSSESILKAINQIPSCIHDTTMQIEVFDEVYCYIPNTFTPNGDELNNEFKPILSSSVAEEHYSLFIFNRWGEIIFSSQDPNIAWNGYVADRGAAPDGVYSYQLSYRFLNQGKSEVITGHVHLLR